MQKDTKASLQILAAGILWGCIGIFLKLLNSVGLSSMQAVALRMLFSAILYTGWLFFTNRDALKIQFKDLWCFIGTGICSLVFFNWSYFNAIQRSSMGVAAVLLYTAPIFVMLISAVLFHEKITPSKFGALALAFSGCSLVSGVLGGNNLTISALLYGLGAGFGYALYSIFGVFALRRYSPQTVTLWSFIIGMIGAIPLTNWSTVPAALCTWQGIIGSLGISLVCCLMPYLLYTLGLTNTEAGRASTIATIEPVVAATLGIILFHEDITVQKLLGIACVVAAVAWLNRKPKANGIV